MSIYEAEECLFGDYDSEYYEIQVGSSIILLNGPEIQISELGLSIRPGQWCEKDDECGYISDWTLSLIHRTEDAPDNYLFYEHGSPAIALYDYLQSIGMDAKLLDFKAVLYMTEADKKAGKSAIAA